MKAKATFLYWALFATGLAIASTYGVRLGWLRYLRNDPTHFTLGTIAVFCIATAWIGRLSWKLSSGVDPVEVEEDLGHGWFASSLVVSIGLAGTAIGYYLMLQSGDVTGDPSQVIRQAFASTSVAIVNTVVGAICGILLELQSHFLGHAVRKAVRLAAKVPSRENEP